MSLKIHSTPGSAISRSPTPPSLKPNAQEAIKSIDHFFARVGQLDSRDINEATSDVCIELGMLKGKIQSGEVELDNTTMRMIQLATATIYTGK